MRADPNDRHRLRLSLTARGNRALARLQMTANQDLARLTAGLADDEAQQLSDALKRITRLLGGDMGETATSGIANRHAAWRVRARSRKSAMR
ncbi:hypothetical protein AJ88_07855 [Mesorhizobium amorphae CCBAU 01583]|nr:hypothetical protein AJ88_07855 [Mesorhizobium amorphae CCBAU 01583]